MKLKEQESKKKPKTRKWLKDRSDLKKAFLLQQILKRPRSVKFL